jgi:hypothetical protein
MRTAKFLLIIFFVAPLFVNQAWAEESWSDKLRGSWERIKSIGDKGLETAKEVAKAKKSGKNHRGKGEQKGSKGLERAKEAGGKAWGSERSKNQRRDGVKSWKKDKNNDDNHGKSRGKSKGKGKGRGHK